MADNFDETDADTLKVDGEPMSAARILAAIDKAERAFNDWQGLCDQIDEIYGRRDCYSLDFKDPEYDLFWASMEIMKPAVYAKPPKPVVSPLFKDRRQLQNTTADLLERSIISAFYRADIDEAMCCTRDDLIFYNRGALWVTLEDEGGRKVCTDHLDRKDFLHPPARKWSEVPWVARRAWMTRDEMKRRFQDKSRDAYQDATLSAPDRDGSSTNGGLNYQKAGVWEVWHKADNRVYWVAPGVNVLLDSSEPYLKLRDFFPCPRPAYGTLQPRTLKPVPDYVRYEPHFNKINRLTRRIYTLLDQVKLKVLIPAGGDVGDAVEQALTEENDMIVIPVPAAALIGTSTNLMVTLPIKDVAEAISGLIAARRELFSDYDRLSGISDIMRGETEADETLGAQQLKSQYGSVRVRDKIEELQRIARDVTQISAEIMAEHFSQELLLDMSQMEIPTKAEIEKQVASIEAQAKQELQELGKNAQQMAMQAQSSGQQIDPNQAQQQFRQAQQQIIAKHQPMLQQAEKQVPIEDVMKLLRDDKARNFAFEIETDSTVLTDELQEKASRNEFLKEFTGASQALLPLMGMGDEGAELGGEILKFVLAPYRVGRSLNAVIDKFIDAAPKLAAQQQENGNQQAEAAVAEANQKLAQAELIKANAKVVETQTKAQQAQVDNQRKIAELQTTAQDNERRFAAEIAKLQAQVTETEAKVRNLDADTALKLSKIGNDNRTQDREDVKTVADIGLRHADHQQRAMESDRSAAMNERQQSFSEQQGARSEDRADRQQSFAEKQAEREPV